MYGVTIEECSDEDDFGGDGWEADSMQRMDESMKRASGSGGGVGGHVGSSNRIPDPHDPAHVLRREKHQKRTARSRMKDSGGGNRQTFAEWYNVDGQSDLRTGTKTRQDFEAMLQQQQQTTSPSGKPERVHPAVYFNTFAAYVDAHTNKVAESPTPSVRDIQQCAAQNRKTRKGRSFMFG